MNKTKYVVAAVLLALMALAACSKQENTDKKTDTGKKEFASIYGDRRLDSLAAIRFKIRNPDNPFVTLETSMGKMTLELYRDVAPAHADSFAVRAAEGFYNQTIFHRVIKNFMIQGGFVQLMGREGVKYFLPDEFSTLQHREGALSAASTGQPNSSQVQFFICLSRNPSTASLDGRYTIFGQLIKGYDVLQRIGDVPVEASKAMGGEVSSPVETVALIKAYISDAEGNPVTP